jgi:hypothetical protein
MSENSPKKYENLDDNDSRNDVRNDIRTLRRKRSVFRPYDPKEDDIEDKPKNKTVVNQIKKIFGF